jgi:hypothetical protein
MLPSEKRQTPTGSKKKAYNRPQLQVYGDLQEITRSVANTPTAKTDAGPPNHTRTN